MSVGFCVFTGAACRDKVIRFLKKRFKTIEEAEDHYNIDYTEDHENDLFNQPASSTPQRPCTTPFELWSPVKRLQFDNPVPGQIIEVFKDFFGKISRGQRANLLHSLFMKYLQEDICIEDFQLWQFVPSSFLEDCGLAIKYFLNKGKENTLLHLARIVGRDRVQLDRMPFGMIAYNCKFFASERSGNIKIPDDYLSWMTTMYAHFGSQWASLHLGPTWSHTDMESNLQTVQVHKKKEEAEPGKDERGEGRMNSFYLDATP